MKLSFTTEEVERWRDKIHRRLPRLAITTKEQTVQFVNDVGFCFAFKSEDSELPCLWHAVCAMRNPAMPEHTHRDPYLSFVWEMKRILPAEKRVIYGRVLRKRPAMISTEFFPYFYAISQRTGEKDDYLHEFKLGHLSIQGKEIMDSLHDSSPQVTRCLKVSVGASSRSKQKDFEKALVELQAKFHIVKSGEFYDPFTFEWTTVDRAFPALVRKAQRVSRETARRKILRKYFENQLVVSTQATHRLFGWKRQTIYEALGQLANEGLVTAGVKLDGRDSSHYCLVK